MAIHPTPRPLPINVHRNRKQTNADRESTNGEEDIPCSLCCKPIVDVIHEPESKEVFDEVHRSECFSCLFAMAIYDVGHDTGSAELNTEVDEPESDDHGNFPGVESVGCLAPGEEAGCGEKEVCYHDWETEFGFCWSGVSCVIMR